MQIVILKYKLVLSDESRPVVLNVGSMAARQGVL